MKISNFHGSGNATDVNLVASGTTIFVLVRNIIIMHSQYMWNIE
jgi:hypothetical protein